MSFRGPDWDALAARGAAGLTVTMRRYLDQIALSLAEESIRNYATTLRQFTAFLLDFDPPCSTSPTSTATTSRPTSVTSLSDPPVTARSCPS